jgi:hypothetical protein
MNTEYLPTLGRLTISGDVENWGTDGLDSNRLKITEMCDIGDETDRLANVAIRHLDIPVIPLKSHMNCRHKRWGSSYELMFCMATYIAIRNDRDTITIWNHPYHTAQVLQELDDNSSMNEHLGAFLYTTDKRRVVISGDGRLLEKNGCNYWHRYMQGESASALSLEVESSLLG